MNKKKSILIISFILILFIMLIVIEHGASSDSTYISPSLLCKVVLPIILILVFLEQIISKMRPNKYANYISLNNTSPEFENLYKTLYSNHIKLLEKWRKQIKLTTILRNITFILFLLGLFCIDNIIIISPVTTFTIIIVGIISLPISIFLFVHNLYLKSEYVDHYKYNIINSFLTLLNNKLTYSPSSPMLEQMIQDYRMAIFDKQDFNTSSADDYIEGYLDNSTFVKMCDIHVQNITGDSDSKHVKDLFQGMFAFTNSTVDVKSYIKISKSKLITSADNFIEMDNNEFEKHFDVYSPNKILAMQILTPDVMECLIDFHNQYKLDFEITIKDDLIYLRFFTGSMFEPKIYGNSMDKQLLFTYFCIVKFILEVTQKINITLQSLEI